MENTFIVKASVVSRKGISSSGNNDNFYINGRYMYEHESDAVQVTVEKRSGEGLFAICSGMNNVERKDSHIVSVIKELDKYSRKVNSFKVDIRSKLEMLGERVTEVHNLIHSMQLDESAAEDMQAAFSGLVFSDGKAAALNIGETAVFLLRNGVLRHLTIDYSKPHKLIKMGIIPKEGKGGSELQVSDIIEIQGGDLFLLCSEGVAEALDDGQLTSLLAQQDEDPDYLAASTANEAIYNGAQRDLTAMVIKIKQEEYAYQEIAESAASSDGSWSDKMLKLYEKKQEALRTFIIAALTCIVIAGIALATPAVLDARKNRNVSLSPQATPTVSPKSTGTQGAVSPSLTPKSSVIPSVSPGASTSPSTSASATPKPTASAGSVQPSPSPTATPLKPSVTPGASSGAERTYTVVKGDTLQSISNKFYNNPADYKKIMEKNNIKDPNDIKIGQVLIIP